MTQQEFKIKCLQLSLYQEQIKVRGMQMMAHLAELEKEGFRVDKDLEDLVCGYKSQLEHAFPGNKIEITSDFDIVNEEQDNG